LRIDLNSFLVDQIVETAKYLRAHLLQHEVIPPDAFYSQKDAITHRQQDALIEDDSCRRRDSWQSGYRNAAIVEYLTLSWHSPDDQRSA
jgi:hypothetical protein